MNETTEVAKLFNRFSDDELEFLLRRAGVVPMNDRGMKIHQVLVVWFHGDIPNVTELVEYLKTLCLTIS